MSILSIVVGFFSSIAGRFLQMMTGAARRGAQEAASRGLEDANERAVDAVKIDEDIDRMSDEELNRRLKDD